MLQRLKSRIVPEQGLEKFLGALGREGGDAQLPIAGLASPAVLVFGSIVHQEQYTRGGQTLHEAVQEGLRLGIDPVQVLEHQQQRLDLALTYEQPLDTVEHLLAALRGVQALPLGIIDGHVEEPEKCRKAGLERTVQREQLARRLLPDLARVVAHLDLEVGPQEIDDRQKCRRLAIRHRTALNDQPALGAMRVREFPE